ncbi:MAG: PqqD family protein [Gemmatimonadota bacterium]|nr:PqqD family protein [Gemmatimonadota bacterium]
MAEHASGPRGGLASVNVLDVTPVRLADWEDHDDRVVIIRPRPRVPWYLLPIESLRYGLAVRRIRLDPIGSLAWRSSDGTRTVAEIVCIVREAIGTDAEPVEQRLGQLIRRLRQEGLLAYRDLDTVPGPPGQAVELPLT